MDVNGRLVVEKSFFPKDFLGNTEGGINHVDVTHLVSGVYIVTVRLDNQMAVARFVKL